MNKKSITIRDVSEEELNWFLGLFPKENRDDVIKLMSSEYVAEIRDKKSFKKRGVSEEGLKRFLDLFPKENRDDVIKLMSSKYVTEMRNRKSITKKGVSEEELERFLDLFPKENRDEVIELMSNKHVAAIQLIIVTKENPDDYHESSFIVIDTRKRLGVRSLRFGQKVAYFNEEDKAFILSFISRCFASFKLIFSSSSMVVFVANTDNMSATTRDTKYVLNDHLLITLLSNGNDIAMLDLSQNNAEVSDDIWNIILSDRDNVNYMISAYISKERCFSDNIKKRIRALYDSLPDSEKPIAVDESEKNEAVLNAVDEPGKNEADAVAEISKKISEIIYDTIDEWYARNKKENSDNVDYPSILEKIYGDLKKGLAGGEDSTSAGKTDTE